MSGRYFGGYQVREKQTAEGLEEAREDDNNPQVKDTLSFSHFGINGLDDKPDFPQEAPSNYDSKAQPKKPKPVLDTEFRKHRERFELFNAETLFNTNFKTVPGPMPYARDPDNIRGMTPEQTAHLLVSQKQCLFYHGYRMLDKADLKDEIRTLYKLSNEDLQGGAHPAGLISGGYLKQYIIDKVRQADNNKEQWFEQTDDPETITASSRILPDQYDDLDGY